MLDSYRGFTPLPTESFSKCPLHKTELVHMDDPATLVLTDFIHNRPATIASNTLIDAAMQKMKRSHEHLLLVIDEVDIDQQTGKKSGAIIGQITSCDILGDAPIKLAQSMGIPHKDISVKMIMTPRKDIKTVDWSHIRNARVGNIIATLHERECCHILVVEDGTLRGIISQSEIAKHMDHFEAEPLACSHSLAELVHRIG